MSPVDKKPLLAPTLKIHDDGSDSDYDSDADELKDPWCDPDNPRIVGFEDITAASFRIRGGIIKTPCDVRGLK